MEVHSFLLIILFSPGLCEWVLLTSVFNQNNSRKHPQNEFCSKKYEEESHEETELFLDIHNLTAFGYASKARKVPEFENSDNGWKISYNDVVEILKLNQQIPDSTREKLVFVKKLGENLAAEAEKRIQNLFPLESREARTSYIYYPTMESTLMTISMLLFGVYLTKLIVRLFQSQQNRININAGILSNIRGPLKVGKARGKRSAREIEKIHILKLINEYGGKFI